MTSASAADRASAPRPKLSPVAWGLLAGGGLAALSLALTFGFGWAEGSLLELRFWRDPRGWFDAVFSGLFGWTVGSSFALMQGARHDLAELRPALLPGTPLPEMQIAQRSLRWTMIVGTLLGLAINVTPANWPDGFPALTDPLFVWSTLRTMLVSWAICYTGLIATTMAARFSQLGPALRVDDLLDLRPLAPLGRCGLRNVAVWVGISAFFAAMMMAPFGRSVAAANLVVSAVVGLGVFLAPVRGAHRRLTEARANELMRVRAALRQRVDDVPAPDTKLSRLSLADLIAWEGRLERVRTWPFDTSMVVRFAFYVAIGLGSWVGAALVERALGAALG